MCTEAPISEKTNAGMSMNIDDRKFIKMQIDGVIDRMDEKMTDNLRIMAEIIITNNDKMCKHLDEQKDLMRSIEKRITSLQDDVKKIGVRVESLEERIQLIETRLDDYYLRLKNHKHE